MKLRILTITAISLLLLISCNNYSDLSDGLYADIKTDKGNIIIKLYPELTPLTVANFVSLAEGTNPKVSDSLKGKRYFDGLTFHRVVKDFVVQAGDPLANGTGGPGYTFYDEFPRDTANALILKHDGPGIVSMANPGPKNTNGSQFFITHKATPWLDGKHTVFGKVEKGQEVVDSIAQKDVIESITIVRNGSYAKNFDAAAVFTSEMALGKEKEKERIKKEAEIEKVRYEKFLADAKKFQKEMDIDKSKKLSSGLQILKLKNGKGNKVSETTDVSANYTLYLANGQKLQSTEGRDPFNFNFSKRPIIPGFKEGVLGLKEGAKVRLFIPYYLAYGEQASGPFPAKADIIFDVEILKVTK